MKKRILYYVLFVLTVFTVQYNKASASHIYGGDLLYEHISGNRYKVVLTIYGDCAGQQFPTLATADPTMLLLRGKDTIQRNIHLIQQPGSGKEVTPVCPADSNNTACKNPTSSIPGIAQFIFSATITLPGEDTDWIFAFAGNMGAGSGGAGRTNAISNVNMLMNGSLMYLEARLNNVGSPNSSPKYTTIPTPFFCANKTQEYSQGATDPNNDSIYFRLTPALISSGVSVTYINPYKGDAPLSTIPGTFIYSNQNGHMSFTPNIAQVSLVANRLDEYRNGKLVGTSMREMTFIVFADCANNPPGGKIDTGIIGGINAPGNAVNVCQGTQYVAFKVNPLDADGDNIIVSSTDVPEGAELTIANNGTPKPVVNFLWKPDVSQPLGEYTFYLNYKDDGCPLSSYQSVGYTVRVVKPFEVTHEVVYPTECAHNAYIRLTVTEGFKPRVIDVSLGKRHLRAYTDSNNADDKVYIVADSFIKGTYYIQVFSPYVKCITYYQMDVTDSGTYPFPPVYDDIHTCVNAPVEPIKLLVDTSSFKINWYDAIKGGLLPQTPEYTTDVVREFNWKISRTHLVCESEKVDFNVIVHAPPVAAILNHPVKICLGDEVYLTASGGVTYTWLPKDKIKRNATGDIYTNVMTTDPYFVVAASEYGCLDTASIAFNDIEQCCKFSYPNAFTPNGDGRNDGFKPLFYGNASEYRLSVYNRFGQEVFRTNDPAISWDGKFNSKPCDMGVYFYKLKAKCLTGYEENGSGDIMLIR